MAQPIRLIVAGLAAHEQAQRAARRSHKELERRTFVHGSSHDVAAVMMWLGRVPG
jgi:hypothetical protein